MDLCRQIIVFVKIEPRSLIIFWEIFGFFKNNFLSVNVYPIKEDSEILKFFKDSSKELEHVEFLLIGKNCFEKIQNKSIKNNPIFTKDKGSIQFREHKFKGDFFSFLESLFYEKFHFAKNFRGIDIIEPTSFLNNFWHNPYYFSNKLKFKELPSTDIKNRVWVKSVITWFLYFSQKLPIQICSSRIKKLFQFKNNVLETLKLKNQDNEHRDMVFIKDLPLYFLYHSTIIDSFLSTPSIIYSFELWKGSGFSKILQFLGKIYIFKEDIKKFWFNFEEKKKNVILNSFELEIKKIDPTSGTIYNFKRLAETSNIYTQISCLESALGVGSILDRKINRMGKSCSKKKFWRGFEALNNLKKTQKFTEREKNVYKFISRMGRIVLLKKLFISGNNARFLFVIGSDTISYRMVEGLLDFLIMVFNKNKLTQKLFLLIIKETNLSTMFISHQNKSLIGFYKNLIMSNQFTNIIQYFEKKKEVLILKVPRTYEKSVLTRLSNYQPVNNTHSLFDIR